MEQIKESVMMPDIHVSPRVTGRKRTFLLVNSAVPALDRFDFVEIFRTLYEIFIVSIALVQIVLLTETVALILTGQSVQK